VRQREILWAPHHEVYPSPSFFIFF
jgi:hypothetical protein